MRPIDPPLRLIAFAGLPGTGKSTLADQLAAAIGAPSFAGDWLLGALKPHGVLTGLDRPTFLAMYYNLLETLVTRQLFLGQSAVVDCLVNDEIATRWQQLADQYDARLHLVECVCSDEIEHRRRIEGRRREIPGWHEVGWNHVQRMRAEYPPLTVAHLTLDAMNPVDHNLELVQQIVAERD